MLSGLELFDQIAELLPLGTDLTPLDGQARVAATLRHGRPRKLGVERRYTALEPRHEVGALLAGIRGLGAHRLNRDEGPHREEDEN